MITLAAGKLKPEHPQLSKKKSRNQEKSRFAQSLDLMLVYRYNIKEEGLKSHSSLIDCLLGELYGSINMAEISDGVITAEHANYLRKKYLYGAGI